MQASRLECACARRNENGFADKKSAFGGLHVKAFVAALLNGADLLAQVKYRTHGGGLFEQGCCQVLACGRQ